MGENERKVIRGFTVAAVSFFIFIFLLMIVLSYFPMWRLEAGELTGIEYFKANVLNDFGIKLIVSTFVSPAFALLTVFGYFKILDKKDEKNKWKQ